MGAVQRSVESSDHPQDSGRCQVYHAAPLHLAIRERELPVGLDGGYLWRLNTYWRFLERDGGTYMECESLTLTRGIPFGIGWIIRPFVTSIPRESLEFTLNSTRKALARAGTR